MAAPAPETIADVKPTDLLPPAAAARLLGVCRDTVYAWAAAGTLKVARYPGGGLRVPGHELLRLLGDAVPPPAVRYETLKERQARSDRYMADIKTCK